MLEYIGTIIIGFLIWKVWDGSLSPKARKDQREWTEWKTSQRMKDGD
jgi:hypothetical protein